MKATDFKWYHEIRFPDGETTVPESDYRDQWAMVRRSREHLNYKDATVLDCASWDGMWAFEAEAKGAQQVYATDVISQSSREDIRTAFDKFNYARQKLNSKVIAYHDRSIHSLTGLLPIIGEVNILQNLGLMYHLENPWHALKQCRLMLKDGGHMLLETAYDMSAGCSMRLNRGSGSFYTSDVATYWAPTRECLFELLKACMFSVIPESVQTLVSNPTHSVDRISLVARAVIEPQLTAEFYNDYRTAI